MNTMIRVIFAALMSAQAVQAKTAFTDIQAFAPGLYSEDLAAFNAEVPAPYPADLRDSLRSKSIDNSDVDAEKAELMAKLALKHLGRPFGGRCYEAVWYDVLVKAGFPDDNNVPSASAYLFAEHAKNNPEWLKNYKLKIIPTPDTLEELPNGSVIVYGPGQEDPYGRAHKVHGHIEIIAVKDGARYGCSDACANIEGAGAFLAKPAAKENVTVLVPII